MWRRAALSLSLGLLLAMPAHALDAAGAREVAAKLQEAGNKLYSTCPADVYKPRRASFLPSLSSETACAASPVGCYAACMLGSGAHCIDLARALQTDSRDWHVVYEQMFTAACAGGQASGCTNRGGGVRNGSYAGDPISARGRQYANRCTFRSFRIACTAGDAWGCAMEGQAHRNGEGTRRNTTSARARFNKACKLGPNSRPCEFARDYLR